MKRSISVLLLMILALSLLAGCGKGKEQRTSGEEKSESLWGRSVSYERVALPDKVLETDGSAARAISPDGRRIFVSAQNGHVPYLWDVDGEEKIPVTVGNEITAGALRMLLGNAAAMNLKDADALDEFLEGPGNVDSLKGDKLLEAVFSSPFPPFLTASGASVPVKDNVLIVTDSGGTVSFVLDADTGALYASPEGTAIGVADGVMYCLSKPNVIKYEMTTGKELDKKDFSFAMENGILSGAFVLSDGTLCGVVYDFGGDVTSGVECVLGVLRPDGGEKTYSLGKRPMSQIPARLCTADGKYFVLQNSVSNDCATLVDAATGEATLLVPKGSALEKVPLDERLDEDGAVNALPDDGGSFRFFTGMDDGETLFCADKDGEPSLFRPSSGEVQRLLPGVVMPVFTSYSGNGYDRWLFYDPINFKNEWIRFNVK